MGSHYREWNYKGSQTLPLLAGQLLRARPVPSRLSPFIYMTDPERGMDPCMAAKHLPQGSTIIYRHFGDSDRSQIADQLRQICFDRGLQFLIGNDPELAISSGADGVHFKRDASLSAPMRWRQKCPDWLITMAGMKGEQAYHGDLSCLDGMLISSVFDSQSPSAGPAIGVKVLSQICRTLPVPVFALGGINATTAPDLIGTGAAGMAGVSGLLRTSPDLQ